MASHDPGWEAARPPALFLGQSHSVPVAGEILRVAGW